MLTYNPFNWKQETFDGIVKAVRSLAMLTAEEREEIASSLEHPELNINSAEDDAACRAIAQIIRQHSGKL